MSTLKTRLASLAASFADEVLRAIRSSSLQELVGETGSRRGPGRPPGSVNTKISARSSSPKGRLPRRSVEDIQKTLSQVVTALKSKPMRAEQIRQSLKIDRRALPRVLQEGLSKKVLRKKGQKRATTYSAA